MRHILSRTPLRAVIGAAMASVVMVLAGCGLAFGSGYLCWRFWKRRLKK